MIYKFLKIVKYSLPALLVAVASSMQAADSSIIKGIKKDISQELLTHQEIENQSDIMVKAANKAYFSKNYKEAIDKYLEAITLLKKASANQSDFFSQKIAICKEQIYRSYYYWARKTAMAADKLSQAKQFNQAIDMCREAIKIYPPCKRRMNERIAQLQKQQKIVEYRTAASTDKLLPELADKEYEMQIMMKQGDAYLKAKKYYQAREKYEQVLLIDPYKLEAINRLRVANIKIGNAGEPRHRAYNKERVAESVWKSVLPIKPSTMDGEENSVNAGAILKVSSNDAIIKKLNNIIIPKIIFEDVSLPAAINHLRRISKQLDPEGVGVNIFLMLNKPETEEDATTLADTADGGGDGGGPGGPGAEDAFAEDDTATTNAGIEEDPNAIPTVTLRLLSSKSLGQVIHYVCKSAQVKYRVERYAVVVARKDIALDDLETRIYPVEESVLSSVGSDLKQYFIDSGIAFPGNSKAIYDRRISRLIVTNTPSNLTKIEQFIHEQLSAPEPQVLIQAKFIEIEQNDLNELSFQYNLSRTLDVPGQSKLEFAQNDNVVRSISNTSVFTYKNSSNGYDFGMVVNAVDQADSKDLLSSPRVVTRNGEEATINMIREVYYPSDWSEAVESSSIADNVTTETYLTPIPEFDEPERLGIVLVVLPTVDMEKKTITLHMNPTVRTFLGFNDYGYDIERAGEEPVHVPITREIIGVQSIDTNVTVYDGETIVLGGIIRDEVEEINDKVPILGDLPLVGRMFQSSGTSSKKINLLIFLTCRLVRPDGTLFNPKTKSRGVPFFDRIK